MGQLARTFFKMHIGKIVFLFVSFLSCESMANQVDALQAAMAYPGVASTIPLISKIEVVGAYHCPDCYDIRITGFDNTASVQMDFRTLVNSQNKVEAKLVEVQRAP